MEYRDRVSRLTVFLVIIFIPLFMSACATERAGKRIQDFAAASSLVATNTVNAYETVDQNYYRAKVASLVIDYDKEGFHPNRDFHLLLDEDFKKRKDIIDGLAQYANKLSEMMSNKQLTEFDEQTKSLGQALNTFVKNPSLQAGPESKRISTINDQHLDFLTTGINALGNFLIREKRDKTVKQIVKEMNDPIKKICTALMADIGQAPDKNGQNGSGLRQISWVEYDSLLRDQDSFIQHNRDRFDPRTKAEEIAKLPALVDERRKIDQTLAATQDALKKLVETHEQLVTAFEKDSPNLENLIGELSSDGKRIKDFYDKLGKK